METNVSLVLNNNNNNMLDLSEDNFYKLQNKIYFSKKRIKWLEDNIKTLNLLLNHIIKNRNTIINYEYSKYRNLLIKKKNEYSIEFMYIKKPIKEYRNIILHYVPLNDDVCSHIALFISIDKNTLNER